MKRSLILILFFSFITLNSFATHMRAGEITYIWKSGLTYEVTIVTYTYTLSPADRPYYDISWGDGKISTINRNEKIDLPNDVSKNIYVGQHTYPGADTYIISLEDPNRNGGVINIPSSINTPFYIETKLVINPFLGVNNSPILLNSPIDMGCVNTPFIHNPGAYDVDGDSISYKLTICKTEDGQEIKGYSIPTSSNSFSMDPISGDLLWDSPLLIGEYNVAFLIEEWRYGQLIGSTMRDMQIEITVCDNKPPIIANINDTCILAGTLLEFNIVATDPDTGDIITLSATGGPFQVATNPAVFVTTNGINMVTSTFSWNTTCEHVKKQPYTVTVKAKDNSYPAKLTDFETFMITVVAPPPENVTATPIGNNIIVKWNKSPCLNAIGYKIYRKNGLSGFVPDHCETGVPSYTGYVLVGEKNNINDTIFTDSNSGAGLIHGIEYCYIVIAYFIDDAESYASNEACTTLVKDIPIITNVSVNNTDASNGSIYIAWSKPTEMDTIQIPGPYEYKIYHSNSINGNNFTLLNTLMGLNDTTYLDTLINTVDSPWSYRIDLWNKTAGNEFFVGSTQIASSIFLSFIPSDNSLLLNFNPVVPWDNDTFVIYKQDPISLIYDSIGFSLTNQYNDSNLVNGNTYCYKVKSIGSYFSEGLINPIINYSQENCGIPLDNEPPSPPVLYVIPDCEKVENNLIWTNQNHENTEDIINYNIYYSSSNNQNFELISVVNNPNDTFFIHKNLLTIAGCYMVTAVDSFQNESNASNIICLDIDSCDIYKLPNVFTPDGDQINDFFIPFPYNFVEKINLKIFNRWGNKVFETEDPNINWDGKNKFSGEECSPGVYFYICDVYEIRLIGIKKRTLNGYIHILRNKK